MCKWECWTRCPIENFDKIVKMMWWWDQIPWNKELKEAWINPCKKCLEWVKTQVEELTPKK